MVHMRCVFALVLHRALVGRIGRPLVSVLTQTVYGSLGESLLI